MFRKRIIYRLILVFIVFALMIVLPLSFTFIKQVNNMVAHEETLMKSERGDYELLHKEFVPQLLEQMAPFAFYVFVLSFILSIFFLRKTLISLKHLRNGSVALKEGNLDTRLEVVSEDELGDVTRAFNEMAATLREKTLELRQKDIYINAMLDPLWVVDEKNNLVDINPAFTRLFGYSRDEAIGLSIYDFFDERNAAIIRTQLEDKREKGIASIYEINVLTKDGRQVPVLISGSPIYSGDRLVGKIGILKDFREQSELRNELQRSKEYVETIMDSIDDQILVVGRDYRIIRANRIALAETQGPVIGEFCHTAAHAMARPCWAEGQDCPAQTVFLTGKTYRTTHQHVGPGGDKRYQEIVASPIRDAAGNVLHVIELIRDVTERIRHEEEIFRKNRELVALNSVAGILTRSLRPEEIFTKVLDKVLEMMRMDGGGIFFIDEIKKEMTCQYHRGISDEFLRLLGRIRLGEDIPGRVAVSGQSMTTSDLSKDQRIEWSILKHSGIKGYSCIPIRGKEKIIGVFCLFSFRLHSFTSEEENILVSIGEMTGIAIENIKLYEKMRGMYEFQRKRREEEQAQILSLSSKLGSAIELSDIMGGVLEHIKYIFSADFSWLLVSDDAGNLMLKSATAETGKEKGLIYPKGISSIEGYSIDKKVPTVIHDVRSEAKFYMAPELADKAYQSAVSVPLHIGEKTVGVYTLYYLSAKDFREEDLHFLRIIGNILAVSLERSDYYSTAILEKGLSDAVLQSVADGIITVDTGGRILSVNKAFEKMSGSPAAYAVGLPSCDVFRYAEENQDFRFALGECIEAALDGREVSREARLTTVSGNRMPVLINSAPVLNAAGTVAGVVNLLRDISREKEIDRMKTEIIRSVSHEFRTPLSAIVGMTEMILEGDIEENRSRKYLRTILSEGMRLSHMVTDLLSIARIESGMETMRYGTVDIKSILESILESFSSNIGLKKARISVDVAGAPYFMADGEKIKQLLMNLIDNSLMFSDEGCSIEIKTRKSGDRVEIIVSDNGWGISEDDIPHLTERFYRGRHGEKVKGTGLGLSLCSEIARLHGGGLHISSKPGAGTEITVSIPYQEAE